MKKISKCTILTGLAAALVIGSANLLAQPAQPAPQDRPDRPGRGNFDPEQMRQRMMERMRERLEVKDDAEWKLIQERIEKVNEARRAVGVGGPGFGGMFGRRGGGADNQPGPRRFGVEPSPEAEALQQALEAKASNEDIKAKLVKLREARKAAEAKLEQAQEELRKVLGVRQEAQAVLMGLLK